MFCLLTSSYLMPCVWIVLYKQTCLTHKKPFFCLSVCQCHEDIQHIHNKPERRLQQMWLPLSNTKKWNGRVCRLYQQADLFTSQWITDTNLDLCAFRLQCRLTGLAENARRQRSVPPWSCPQPRASLCVEKSQTEKKTFFNMWRSRQHDGEVVCGQSG